MRRYLLIALLLVSCLGFAQQSVIPNNNTIKSSILGNQKINRNKLTASGTIERWYSYVNAYEKYYGQKVASLNANYLFPDSTVIIKNNDSSFSSPWIHSLGVVMDFKIDMFGTPNPNDNFYSYWPFHIDSLMTSGIYTRVSDSTIVDTLEISFYQAHQTAANLNSRSYYYNNGITANLGTDTLIFVNFMWDSILHKAPGPLKVIKVLMDDKFYTDTNASGIHQILTKVNQSFPLITSGIYNLSYNGVVGVTYSFKPGYSWNVNLDTLGVNINSWQFLSWELEGDSTFPRYDKNDWNTSYIISKDVRYRNNGWWNGYYVPSFTYMANSAEYKYEAHETWLKVSQNVGSVNEKRNINFTVYPNPSNEELNVKFGSAANGTYTVILLNIFGQEVYNTQVDATANQVESLNFSSLDKGVYLLSISGNGMNTVQRVVLK